MDAETVDQNYSQLQQQAQQTVGLIQTLAGKLQAAAAGGDQNAREWLLDLKEITLGFQQEQAQVSLLLQSIHSMVDNHTQQVQQAPPQQVQYQQPQQGYVGSGMGGGGMGGGGMLHRFLGGNLGQAMVMGAGFGIGDDIINSIF